MYKLYIILLLYIYIYTLYYIYIVYRLKKFLIIIKKKTIDSLYFLVLT